MVVDDEFCYLDEVKEIFSQSETLTICWECTTAFSAIKVLEQESPDIMLIDIIMPGMSGIELASRIKKINPLIKVILMSENVSFAVNGYEDGLDGFIQKPLIKSKVLEAVGRLGMTG